MKRFITIAFAFLTIGAHSQFKEVSGTDIIVNKRHMRIQALHLNNGELILQNTRLEIIGDVTGIGEIKGDRNSIIYIGGKVSLPIRIKVDRSPYKIDSWSHDKGITFPAEITWKWFDDENRLLKINSKYKIVNLEVTGRGETLIQKSYMTPNDLIDFSRLLRGIEYVVSIQTVSGSKYIFTVKR